MLLRADGTQFSTGRSRFLDQAPGSEDQRARILVRIEPQSLGQVILAQLDTGAAWSILDAQIAEALSLLDGDGEPVRFSTRLGTYEGRLARTHLDIVADEGDTVTIEATVWVSRDWPGGTFLGYGGLLERIRFAVDPSDNSFYFGIFDHQII
jgi:hypothetical protein